MKKKILILLSSLCAMGLVVIAIVLICNGKSKDHGNTDNSSRIQETEEDVNVTDWEGGVTEETQKEAQDSDTQAKDSDKTDPQKDTDTGANAARNDGLEKDGEAVKPNTESGWGPIL